VTMTSMFQFIVHRPLTFIPFLLVIYITPGYMNFEGESDKVKLSSCSILHLCSCHCPRLRNFKKVCINYLSVFETISVLKHWFIPTGNVIVVVLFLSIQ